VLWQIADDGPFWRDVETTDYICSYAAIIIDIPTFQQRIFGAALQGLGMSGSKRKLEEGVESLAAMASRAVLKHINADGRHATFAFGGAVECPHPTQVIVPLDILKPKVRNCYCTCASSCLCTYGQPKSHFLRLTKADPNIVHHYQRNGLDIVSQWRKKKSTSVRVHNWEH
jgi:hypothetical protein